MNLKLESRDGYLLATAAGQASLDAALELHKKVCDAAAESGFDKVLYDCSGVKGELSVLERYQLGKAIAEHCLRRSMLPKVAVIGKPPTVNGLVAQVAWNRGLVVETFSERQAGLDWLTAFRFNANAW